MVVSYCPDPYQFSTLIVKKANHDHLHYRSVSKAAALNAEKSPAVPFLPYPENVKGYIGDDIAFDPLGISDYFPMDYLREAELK